MGAGEWVGAGDWVLLLLVAAIASALSLRSDGARLSVAAASAAHPLLVSDLLIGGVPMCACASHRWYLKQVRTYECTNTHI
jgi:hypothetical protein